MDRTAWILNLREPFGAALGRELVSRGWKVVGGDPENLQKEADSQIGEKARNQNDSAVHRAAEKRRSGWTHGPHIGENTDIPTGTGTSGMEDFEGSVGFGPESNARPKIGKPDAEYAEEMDGPSFGADPNASNAAGAFVTEETDSQTVGEHETAYDTSAERASSGFDEKQRMGTDSSSNDAQPLQEHGRLHVLPLDGGEPGGLEEAARQTSEIADRIDLLILNAGEIVSDLAAEIDETSDTTDGRMGEYDTYALTPLRVVERLLPLMNAEEGLKRICFVSSREGSISAGDNAASIGRAMAYTALHMQVRLLFNDLHREGYTFRLYDPGLMPKAAAAAHDDGVSAVSNAPMTSMSGSVAESARFAAGYFANPHANEDRIVLTGSRGEEWPF